MKYVYWSLLAAFGVVIIQTMWRVTGPEFAEEQRAKAAVKRDEAAAKQKEYVDGWKKWYEEAKKKNAEQKKEKPAPEWERGFELGYRVGHTMARAGEPRPSSSGLDAVATKAAANAGMDGATRILFVQGYTSGFSFGWRDGD